jgi:hypothetical protein
MVHKYRLWEVFKILSKATMEQMPLQVPTCVYELAEKTPQ